MYLKLGEHQPGQRHHPHFSYLSMGISKKQFQKIKTFLQNSTILYVIRLSFVFVPTFPADTLLYPTFLINIIHPVAIEAL
jgi:hypothetical protein